jgi:hypothetical protein
MATDTVSRANLIMAALAFAACAFIAAMVLAAAYLPMPRDNHLPPPAEQFKEMK